jgi:hypothetical protein
MVDNSIVDTTRLSTNDYSVTSMPAYATACTMGTTLNSQGPDLVFAYTHTGAAQQVTARVTPDSSFDVALARFEGTCAPTACVAMDDSSQQGFSEELTWMAMPNTTYWLVVDGWVPMNMSLPGAGSFRLRIE